MTEASTDPRAKASRITSTVLQAVQRDAKQTAIAAAMGVNDSTVSRLLSDHLDKFSLVLAHAGLKVVPVEMQCFPKDQVHALLTLAKGHLSQIDHPDQLSWE